MTTRAGSGAPRQSLLSAMSAGAAKVLKIALAASLLAGLAAPCFADDGPKPDPSGTATGDKAAAVDAAGNPLSSQNQPTRRLRITPPIKRHSMIIRLKQRKNRSP